MKPLLKTNTRKVILTAAVAAAFMAANPLILNGSLFGGVAHASQSISEDHDDVGVKVSTANQAASSSSPYVDPSVADNDKDHDSALNNTDKGSESTYCKNDACN